MIAPDDKRFKIFREAFYAGFIASREGFNGECPYAHLAPDDESYSRSLQEDDYWHSPDTRDELERLAALAYERYMAGRIIG